MGQSPFVFQVGILSVSRRWCGGGDAPVALRRVRRSIGAKMKHQTSAAKSISAVAKKPTAQMSERPGRQP